MAEYRLFEEGTVPEYTQADWYAPRDSAPHIDQDAHRPRIDAAIRQLKSIYTEGMSVVDLGAGDGGLLSLLTDVPPHLKWGYDLAPANVAVAVTRGQDVRYGNVFDGVQWGVVAVATEMIEHLLDPHGFVGLVSNHSTYLVASSPCGETSDAHYPFHTWAWDLEGYAHMIRNNGWEIVSQEVVGGFQVILAKSTNLV